MGDTDAPKLGILAGGGTLPRRIAERCRGHDRDFLLLLFEGHADPADYVGLPHRTVRLGAAGEIVRLLREAGCAQLVFAGKVERPSWRALRPDWRAARFLADFALKANSGDDALMAAIIDAFEKEGFEVVAPDRLLGEGGLLPGPLGRHRPVPEETADIALGVSVARTLGRLDIGHAVVVQAGLVLGVEAAEGTDALIDRCGRLRREGRGPVLIKLCKPQQDLRADPPVIGPATVARAAAAGFAGIAVEAGGTLVLDRDATAAAADDAGLFLLAVEAAP
ncbi:MAG: LpxI family protein [Pseudomonadota bacterium]